MAKNSIMVELDDPKAAKIAEVISNKTAQKILGLLAEKEMDASDISRELKVPLNTVSYNLKKLVASGLVDKSKTYFWSKKGNKIDVYKISNKRIVIMPKKIVRGVVPAVLVSALAAVGLKAFVGNSYASVADKGSFANEGLERGTETVVTAAESVADSSMDAAGGFAADGASVFGGIGGVWLWFLAGALFGLLVFLIWNWGIRKK